MDRLIRYVNWERVGWLTLQATLALAIIFTLATVFVFAAVVVAGIMEFLGLALVPISAVILGVLYIGRKLAGWTMETIKRNHYDR